jgi:[acyl-carrier-protein] S-malonyltransferase
MRPVQARMAEAMADVAWSDPEVPLVSNASGTFAGTADDVHEALVAQIASPVRWVDCVRALVDAGCTTFLELGPGRVLGGLVRQIAEDVETTSTESPQVLEEFAQARAGVTPS